MKVWREAYRREGGREGEEWEREESNVREQYYENPSYMCVPPLMHIGRPPWQQKILSSMTAAMGRQLKQSVNVFHSLMLYRRLPGWREEEEERERM